jgi:hypothetical protein
VPTSLNELRQNKVESISVQAALANWDRDADTDGIEIRLAPRTADGRVIEINGVMKIDLLGRRYSPSQREPSIATLGQWSQAVRAANSSHVSAAIYRLPFSTVVPDFDTNLQSLGLLRVQLNIHGQGDFFAETTVRIRSYNPIRDQLFEHELRYDSFGRYRGRHW